MRILESVCRVSFSILLIRLCHQLRFVSLLYHVSFFRIHLWTLSLHLNDTWFWFHSHLVCIFFLWLYKLSHTILFLLSSFSVLHSIQSWLLLLLNIISVFFNRISHVVASAVAVVCIVQALSHIICFWLRILFFRLASMRQVGIFNAWFFDNTQTSNISVKEICHTVLSFVIFSFCFSV